MKAMEDKAHTSLQNILYATDFSPAAAAALPYAGTLANASAPIFSSCMCALP
jgi:hypothetical protein